MIKLATLGQGSYIQNMILEMGVPSDQLQALIDRGLLADLLRVKDPSKIDRAAFQRLLGLEVAASKAVVSSQSLVSDEVFKVTVGRMTWVEWIAATGIDPREINSDFNETNFPLGTVAEGEYDLVYYYPGVDSSMEENLAGFKGHGLERPGVEHFLAFAAKFPEEQRKFPIIALLLRLWRDENRLERAPCLSLNRSLRDLDLSYASLRWIHNYRVLGVRPRK